MNRPLRVAVIGVGHLGQHHARLYAGMPDVRLVAVVDARPERAREIASRHGVEAVTDFRDVLDRVDAVSIAVPTILHGEIASRMIERGIAVLVEKPLTASLAEADALLDAANRHGAVLAAGHTERFNPAVAVALPLVCNPRFVEVHRLGTFSQRSVDIDVIFDLMVHDLDVLLAAVGSDVVAIEAVGVNVLTLRTDIANARLRFRSGCIANVTASRISRDRVRKARFFQADSYVSIDYALQEVEMYRLVSQPPAGGPDGTTTPDRQDLRRMIDGGRIDVPREEPLQRELADFVDAVRTGRAPGVSGRAARDALALATRIAEIIDAASVGTAGDTGAAAGWLPA